LKSIPQLTAGPSRSKESSAWQLASRDAIDESFDAFSLSSSFVAASSGLDGDTETVALLRVSFVVSLTICSYAIVDDPVISPRAFTTWPDATWNPPPMADRGEADAERTLDAAGSVSVSVSVSFFFSGVSATASDAFSSLSVAASTPRGAGGGGRAGGGGEDGTRPVSHARAPGARSFNARDPSEVAGSSSGISTNDRAFPCPAPASEATSRTTSRTNSTPNTNPSMRPGLPG
jgi:hypothetical protein